MFPGFRGNYSFGWNSGKKMPTLDHMVELADVLEVTIGKQYEQYNQAQMLIMDAKNDFSIEVFS